MTDREKAIVMAYTGVCMLTGDKFQIYHKYVEDIMGRPIWTHEMVIESITDEIKEKSKADFIALCADESGSENPNKWIPVSERLPEKNMECLVTVGDFNLVQTAMYSNLMRTIDHRIFYQGECGDETFKNITQYVKAWMPLPQPYKAESEDEE